MRHVIIGAGPAGVVAAETLRQHDVKAEILLLRDEPEPAYSRMAIPYLLANKIVESGSYLRHDPEHFNSLNIQQKLARVESIDPENHRLQLPGGETLSYNRLLLATGSQPVRPPVEGLDQPGIHHCWTLEDARAISELARPGAQVTLMGAGFIGCIVMEALMGRGVDLTVIEMGDRMVPRMMDRTAGELIRQWCMGKGVQIHTSTRVRSVRHDSSGTARYQLRCDPDGQIAADLIVVATGVKPNIAFLAGSGIQTASGVLVDHFQRSSVADVYAAGDVCEGLDWSSRHRAVNAIQPAAVETARIAALNMAGRPAPHAGSLAMNVLDTLGLISTSYGLWMGSKQSESSSLVDENSYRYIKLQFEQDHLIGAITLGMTEHVGVLRGLIQARTDLGVWKHRLMENPSRIMEAYLSITHPSTHR
ncbi:MAG: FAD-dependent oxidoreductase [Pseudomonadota bacterium]